MKAELWSVGIVVEYTYRGNDIYGWIARMKFESRDDIFHGDQRVMGELSTYGAYLSLDTAVDRIVELARQMGIEFLAALSASPSVFYSGDGESGTPPSDWKAQVNAQAVRLGWEPLYY